MNHIPLLLSAILAAQEPAPTEKTTLTPAKAAAAETRTALLIDPRARSKDYVEAFELLRREKPALKINIQTSQGLLANVAELTSADNGTLMMVKVPSNQGTKYLIVPLEDITEISYSP